MTDTIYIVGFDDLAASRIRDAVPAGHNTLALDGAEAAHEALAGALPAAVVVNFPQPFRDGRSLTSTLSRDERTAHIPIVAISGWNYRRTRDTASRLGCTAFLAADAPDSEIAAVLRRALGREPRRVPVTSSLTEAVAGSNVA